MIQYKITNLMSSSLTIEDLGIRLSANQSIMVSSDSMSRSSDIIKLERWVRIEPIYSAQPAVQRIHKKRPPRVPVIIKEEPKTPTPPSVLERKIDDVYSMISRLVQEFPGHTEDIKKHISTIPAPAVIPYRPGMAHAHEINPSTSGTGGEGIPMFIPSRIITNADSSNIKTSDTKADIDVDSNIDALKKLRKQKTPTT